MGEPKAVCGFDYSPDGLFAVAWPDVQQAQCCAKCARLTGEPSV